MSSNASSSTNPLAKSKERIADFLAAARDFFRPMLDSDKATWRTPLIAEKGRLDMQVAIAFLKGKRGDVALGNRLIRRAPVSSFEGHRFDIFETSFCATFLSEFDERLEEETRDHCLTLLEEGCGDYPGMSAPDYQFLGMNDNMPMMASKTLILAGQYLNRSDWLEHGHWRIQRLAAQLSRSGMLAEYNSPNYIPDTLHNLSAITLHCADDEIRGLARQILRRLWLDLAARWHSEAKALAGPHSRATNASFNNHFPSIKMLIWTLFGKEFSGVDAEEAMRPRKGLQLKHCHDPCEQTAWMIWYATGKYMGLDADIIELFLNKQYPMTVVGTAEQANRSNDLPRCLGVATTHMTENYSLGTVSVPFIGGRQTASCYVTAGNRKAINPVLYAKYLIDDMVPGQIGENQWHNLTTGEVEIPNCSTSIAVQHESSALFSCTPFLPPKYNPTRKAAEWGAASGFDASIKELRLAIVVPTSFYDLPPPVLAEGEVPGWEGTLPSSCWIGLDLGSAYAAIRPLFYNLTEPLASEVCLKHEGDHHWIEFINYRGPSKEFSSVELFTFLNGFAIELATKEDWNSLQNFVRTLEKKTQLEDYFFNGSRFLRYERAPMEDRNRLNLEIFHCPSTPGTGIRTIQGRPAPQPLWECTGIRNEVIPFLPPNDPYIAPSGIPWKGERMNVYWNPEAQSFISE